MPGLGLPAAKAFVEAVGGPAATVNPKFGWTDVARFTAFGVPAVNYGPGEAAQAHQANESVDLRLVSQVHANLRRLLTS